MLKCQTHHINTVGGKVKSDILQILNMANKNKDKRLNQLGKQAQEGVYGNESL